MMRSLVLVVAVLAAARVVRADDVDEMKKRYANTPGGDAIIAALEAHRAEINGASAKQAAAMKKAGVDGPARSTKDILALVPAPARSSAEAVTRFGKVDDGNGGQTDGDLRVAPAQRQIATAVAARIREGAFRPDIQKAGVVSPGAGPAIQKLMADATKASSDQQAAGAAFAKAMSDAEAARLKSRDAVVAEYRVTFGDCLDAGEGVQPDLKKCAAIDARYRAALKKAKDSFVSAFGAKIEAQRALAAGAIARGDAQVADAKSAIPAGSTLDPTARQQYHRIDGAEMMLVQQLIQAENALVVGAADKDPILFSR